MSVPFPTEAVRDLIGILRAIYAHEATLKHASKRRLALIASVALELQAADASASAHDPGTAPYALAITRAEAATKRLEAIIADRIGGIGSLESVVRTAGSRVRGQWKPYRQSEAQIKWAMGKQRG